MFQYCLGGVLGSSSLAISFFLWSSFVVEIQQLTSLLTDIYVSKCSALLVRLYLRYNQSLFFMSDFTSLVIQCLSLGHTFTVLYDMYSFTACIKSSVHTRAVSCESSLFQVHLLAINSAYIYNSDIQCNIIMI